MQAGVAKVAFQPKMGALLVGYFDRLSGAVGVHDEIFARALVIQEGQTTLVLCSVEVCIIPALVVNAIRERVHQRCGIPHEHIVIFCTHSHSAPALHVAEDWETAPVETVTQAIMGAYTHLQEAQLGAGFGALFGHSINRRFMNRPVDPSVGVLRVDRVDGTPLAILGNFACHNVIMGADNLHISGDWTGSASRLLEHKLDGAIALMSLGGAGDVNPITETVRERIATGDPMVALGETSALYGDITHPTPLTWNIGERAGGTFDDVAHFGRVVSEEILRVWQSITFDSAPTVWLKAFTVDIGTPEAGVNLPEGYGALLPEISAGHIPMAISVIKIGSLLIGTHPVETFSEDGVTFRRTFQQLGYACPMLVTYANGWYGYLPTPDSFVEGGYEVGWAKTFGLRQDGQAVILEAMKAHVATMQD